LNPSVLLLFGISVLVFSACQIETLTRILLLLSVDDFSIEEDLASFSIKKTPELFFVKNTAEHHHNVMKGGVFC
jgi:hypothetical protein